jgi:hypothetical protein
MAKSNIVLKSQIVSQLWRTYDKGVDINRAWEIIRKNVKISAKECLSYYELKMYKTWFDEGCSKLLDQRKPTKLQWLQDPRQISEKNLNNTRCEACRYFGNKKREYIKDKTEELAKNSKNKNIRDLYSGIIKFKASYQPTSNLAKDENGCLQIPTFWIGGIATSLSCWMYIGSVMCMYIYI